MFGGLREAAEEVGFDEQTAPCVAGITEFGIGLFLGWRAYRNLHPVAPKPIKNIGELPRPQQQTLKSIWNGDQPVSALPQDVRHQLADLYSGVAKSNPAGTAQSVFNQARADYLLGKGPNPGRSVVDFAKRHNLPVNRK